LFRELEIENNHKIL